MPTFFFPYGYANSVALLTISMMSTEKSKKLVLGRLRKKNRERNFLISIINKRVSRWFNQRLSRTMLLLQLEVMFIRNKKKNNNNNSNQDHTVQAHNIVDPAQQAKPSIFAVGSEKNFATFFVQRISLLVWSLK